MPVAVPRGIRCGSPGVNGTKQRRENIIVASLTGEHQVFVERRFEGSGIGHAQNRVGWLDIVGNPKARFCLTGDSETIV